MWSRCTASPAICQCSNDSIQKDTQKVQGTNTYQERAAREATADSKQKWTSSNALGVRFKEDVLSQPKSFTRRDFHPLQQVYEEVLSTVRASTPARSLPESPALDDTGPVYSEEEINARQSLRRVTIQTGPPQTYSYNFPTEQNGYWNEYENGSEGGDMADEYVIYIDPDENGSSDLRSIIQAITAPFTMARSWVTARKPERQALLSRRSSTTTYGTADEAAASPESGSGDYFTLPRGRRISSAGNDSNTAVDTDVEEDLEADIGGYSSSEEFPVGYETHYATLPSINDQRIDLYKERVMFLATSGLFAISFLLLGIATVLVITGRHKLRAEVDAAATLGSVVSIGCGCIALALSMARWESLGVVNRVVVVVTLCTVCVLNGLLLVLVMGNTAL